MSFRSSGNGCVSNEYSPYSNFIKDPSFSNAKVMLSTLKSLLPKEASQMWNVYAMLAREVRLRNAIKFRGLLRTEWQKYLDRSAKEK